MLAKCVLFIYCLLIYRIIAIRDELIGVSEPKCYSRFDYDLKMVENIGSLKAAEADLRDTVATLQRTVNTLRKSIHGR